MTTPVLLRAVSFKQLRRQPTPVFPVRYYCPRCETVVTLQRDGYLADKSVTPFPLEGWTYVEVGGAYDDADGVRVVCGGEDAAAEDRGDDYGSPNRPAIESENGLDKGPTETPDSRHDAEAASFDGIGCGEPFYLNFVRFEGGSEVEPSRESRRVELAPDGPARPRGPTRPGG